MTTSKTKQFLTLSLAAAATTALASTAEAAPGTGVSDLNQGYQVAAVSVGKEKKSPEARCGEGKCGGDKAKEAKCGEGKCGGDKAKEAKCGEGKCGGDKAKEAKCGEGKCGGKK